MSLIVACGQRVADHFLPWYLMSTLLTDFFSFFLLLSCSLSLLLIRLIVVFSSIIACFVWPFCIFRPSLRVLCFLSCSLLKNLIKYKLLNSTWPNCIVFDFEKTLLVAEKRKKTLLAAEKRKKTLLAAEKNYFPNALSTQTRVEMSSTGPNYARNIFYRIKHALLCVRKTCNVLMSLFVYILFKWWIKSVIQDQSHMWYHAEH